VHIFFGIVGPVLVTLHTAFKFNGAVSVGYWLMVAVWLSGFVGRYLYVRIPKTIRGVELSRKELEADLAAQEDAFRGMVLPDAARAALDAFDRSWQPAGEFRVRARLFFMRHQLQTAGVDIHTVHDAVSRRAEHAALSRRLIHLERTRRLFELWHVLHRPLVFGMFVIVGLHVALVVYLGYGQALLGAFE
jgi:hypothetical protein